MRLAVETLEDGSYQVRLDADEDVTFQRRFDPHHPSVHKLLDAIGLMCGFARVGGRVEQVKAPEEEDYS